MSRPNENNFKKSTMDFAGRSVGFRCCFPKCNTLLVCRKENKMELLNTAEYAHIAAASPGGPRFDPSLSSEEIRSYENCIVLCSKHHHVVDNDPVTYPTQLLKQWKQIAEERTRQEMLIPNYYTNSDELEAILLSLFSTGEYDVLESKIKDFTDVHNSILNEVILRYNIFLKVVFRKECLSLIDSYLKQGYKNIDSIVLFLIEFDCKKEIEKLLDLIKDGQLKELSILIVNNTTDFIIKDEKIGKMMKYFNSNLQIKYIMNYVFSSLQQFCYILDKNGNQKNFYEDDYYYKFVAFILRLREICFGLKEDFSKDSILNDISIYTDFFDKFNGDIKINCYRFLLMYLATVNSDIFLKYYNKLSSEEQKNKNIMDIYYGFMLNQKAPLTVDELLSYSDEYNDYKALLIFLANNPNLIKEFLEDHKYLLKKDSAFLLLYKNLLDKESFLKEISKYDEIYSNDFLYKNILWNLNIKDHNLQLWCIEHENEISNFNYGIYLENLIMSKENECFLKTIIKIRDVDARANYLLMFHRYNQDCKDFDAFLKEEYLKINKKKTIAGINHNLAILNWNAGEFDEAFECLYKEIDNFSNSNSIQVLFSYRLEKKFYLMDKYFEMALMSSNYYELIYVAETYYYNNELNLALDYYEKALITGVNSSACLFKIFELSNKKNTITHNEVEDNTVVKISNYKESLFIAFHKKNIFNGDSHKNQLWIDACLYSSYYCDFMYRSIGDNIIFNGEDYKIESIEDIYTFYSKLFLNELATNEHAITITGPIEKAKKQIEELTRENYNHRKMMNDKYLEFKDKIPLSMSSKMFFSDRIFYNLLFLLHESNNKLINNLKIVNSDIMKMNFLFYYDTIFALYNISEKFAVNISSNFFITDLVKNRLVNEINSELNEIQLNDGSLSIDKEGQMVFYGRNNLTKNLDSKYLIKFKKFVESFATMKSSKYDLFLGGEKVDFQGFNMEDERSILSIASNSKEYLVVSDNSSFNSFCDLNKIGNVGITDIIGELVPSNKIFEVALYLKQLNYNNYFTINMYQKVRDLGDTLIEFFNHKFELEQDNFKHILILQALFQELYKNNMLDLKKDQILIDFLLRNRIQ